MVLTQQSSYKTEVVVNGMPRAVNYTMDHMTSAMNTQLMLNHGDSVYMAVNGQRIGGVFTAPKSGHYHVTGTITGINGGRQLDAMTQEEKDELEALQREHAESIKLSKLNEFKKLPPLVRESIVSSIQVPKYLAELKNASAVKSARQIELENKDNRATIGCGISFQHLGVDTHNGMRINADYHPLKNYLNDQGITDEQILKAHAEACLEEALE